MTMIALLVGLLAVPALFCVISGLVRFPLKSQDKAVIAQKRWKYARMASRLLVMSWTVYGMAVWNHLPRYLSPQVDAAAATILHAGTLIYFSHFLFANLLGLLTSLPLALAYLLYLIAFAWSDRRIRQEDFPLGGAVRILLFEGTRTLLPYAILFLFVVSGVMPLIAVRTSILHFNWLIAFVMVASCSFVYFKSFDIMKGIMKAVVPLHDAVLEQRVSELANAAGVNAGKLFRLRTFGYPYAQGYALMNRDICLSDHLLDVFDPAEQDAVIAHELGHFKHLKALITKRFAVYLALVVTLLFLFPLCDAYFFGSSFGFPVKFALIYGWLLLMIRLNKRSRGYELEADKLSASVVGDETFMRAMEKLHEVNFLPRQFNDKGKENMTHPSLEMRINAVVQSSDLSNDRQEAKKDP
jgi:Zn-dependent protease with chaperone function